MPQIANQDYNVIDFNVLPQYEGVERLYRAYLNGTAFDCVFKIGGKVNKIITYEEKSQGDAVRLLFNENLTPMSYILKSPLAIGESGFLAFKNLIPIYIVSADGFKLKPVVQDEVLTGVEVTTEKMDNTEAAQYFKEWMIGQPIEGGGVTPK